jgi:tRNA G46 methylase TrmB
LHVATDVADYFHRITELLATHAELVALPDNEIDGAFPTNFERKARQAGREVYGRVYERKHFRSSDPR